MICSIRHVIIHWFVTCYTTAWWNQNFMPWMLFLFSIRLASGDVLWLQHSSDSVIDTAHSAQNSWHFARYHAPLKHRDTLKSNMMMPWWSQRIGLIYQVITWSEANYDFVVWITKILHLCIHTSFVKHKICQPHGQSAFVYSYFMYFLSAKKSYIFHIRGIRLCVTD